MSDFEEETYSTIFTSLKHPVRRKILRMLSKNPRNFSEILEALGISSSHLTYHLENLGELVFKMEDGKYRLSTFGEAAVGTMSKVEETPKVTKAARPSLLSIRWKSFFAVLMIGLVVLAGVSYTQYRSLNRISAEYEQLKELFKLVEKGASLQSKYTLRYEFVKFDFNKVDSGEVYLTKIQIPYCAIYSPYDNSTLYLDLTLSTTLFESYFPISVQEGNALDLRTSETAPVIWSANAATSNVYSVPLASKGWYTISLVGSIIKLGNAIQLRMPFIEDVDSSLSLRIIYEGNYSPFIVMSRPY